MTHHIGFRRSEEEEDEYYPNPLGGVGAVGSLSEGEDSGSEPAEWTFKNHIYISLTIGPFTFIIGRPE